MMGSWDVGQGRPVPGSEQWSKGQGLAADIFAVPAEKPEPEPKYFRILASDYYTLLGYAVQSPEDEDQRASIRAIIERVKSGQ